MIASACLLATLLVGAVGCTKKPPTDAPIATAENLPNVLKSLQEATLPISRRSALNRLKAIGPAANTPEVLKALEEARKKAPPNERPLFDETLAKITGAAEAKK